MNSQISKEREKDGDGALKDGRLDLKGFHLWRTLSEEGVVRSEEGVGLHLALAGRRWLAGAEGGHHELDRHCPALSELTVWGGGRVPAGAWWLGRERGGRARKQRMKYMANPTLKPEANLVKIFVPWG